jgi:ribonuclease HI
MAVAQAIFAGGIEAIDNQPWFGKNLYCPETGKIQFVLHIKSDSKYVVDGINYWLRNWKANKWKNSKKKPISNMQMWKDLDSVLSYGHLRGCFTFSHVPGHSGDPGNDAADHAAREGVDNGTTIPEDTWREMMDMLASLSV